MKVYDVCPETPDEYTCNVHCDSYGDCPYNWPCQRVVKEVCDWCNETDESLVETNVGLICETCIREMKRRGEVVERK